MRGTPLRWAYSVLWTIVLAALCIGASVSFFEFGDVIQPGCSTTPTEYSGLCKPCGLRWGMFGIVDATQCPNSIVDELLTAFVALPRFLFIAFGMAWMLTAPLLVANFLVLRGRRVGGDRSILNTAQFFMLGYILLWALAAAAFFGVPAFLSL